MTICKNCGEEFKPVSKKQKFCNPGCRTVHFYKGRGEVMYSEKCACGCGNYFTSKFEGTRLISGHENNIVESCSLCSSDEQLFDYLQPDCVLKLCKKCYKKVFEMYMEED